MSYILDALRKAEAERERGHVPSIHAQQPMPGTVHPAPARRPAARWGLIGALLLVVVLLAGAGVAWWWFGAGPSSTAAAPKPAPVPAPPPATAVAATTPPLPATSPAPVSEAPVARKAKAMPVSPAQAPVQAPAQMPTPMPTPMPTQTPAQAAAAPDPSGPLRGKIYALSELPDAVRSQLPTLAIGGSMYSPVRANRLLIVNGQVAHEGDTVAPGVVLEQLRVKNAVLTFRGYQYMLPF